MVNKGGVPMWSMWGKLLSKGLTFWYQGHKNAKDLGPTDYGREVGWGDLRGVKEKKIGTSWAMPFIVYIKPKFTTKK